MCARALWFVGENMGIIPFRSLSQFNKCVVFRQTWSQPQPSHIPTHNLWKQPQARRHIHGSQPLYYYNCLTQWHTCMYTDFYNVLQLLCVFRARADLFWPQLNMSQVRSFISRPVFLSLCTEVCFQVGRGRTMTRNVFSIRSHVEHLCPLQHSESPQNAIWLQCIQWIWHHLMFIFRNTLI